MTEILDYAERKTWLDIAKGYPPVFLPVSIQFLASNRYLPIFGWKMYLHDD